MLPKHDKILTQKLSFFQTFSYYLANVLFHTVLIGGSWLSRLPYNNTRDAYEPDYEKGKTTVDDINLHTNDFFFRQCLETTAAGFLPILGPRASECLFFNWTSRRQISVSFPLKSHQELTTCETFACEIVKKKLWLQNPFDKWKVFNNRDILCARSSDWLQTKKSAIN